MANATAEPIAKTERPPEQRSEPSPKRPRVQLDFTPAAYERIKELTQLSRTHSIPDMFRDALKLFDWYQTKKQEGYRLALQKDGKTIPVDLMI